MNGFNGLMRIVDNTSSKGSDGLRLILLQVERERSCVLEDLLRLEEVHVGVLVNHRAALYVLNRGLGRRRETGRSHKGISLE